jgi:hypothetical protein
MAYMKQKLLIPLGVEAIVDGRCCRYLDTCKSHLQLLSTYIWRCTACMSACSQIIVCASIELLKPAEFQG